MASRKEQPVMEGTRSGGGMSIEKVVAGLKALRKDEAPLTEHRQAVVLFDGTQAMISQSSTTTGVVVTPERLAGKPVHRSCYGWTLS